MEGAVLSGKLAAQAIAAAHPSAPSASSVQPTQAVPV
jgi:hypothetical protein